MVVVVEVVYRKGKVAEGVSGRGRVGKEKQKEKMTKNGGGGACIVNEKGGEKGRSHIWK